MTFPNRQEHAHMVQSLFPAHKLGTPIPQNSQYRLGYIVSWRRVKRCHLGSLTGLRNTKYLMYEFLYSILQWKSSALTYTVSQIYYYSPMITFTLALVTARLMSLLIDTLMQKVPESLNTCRRMSWHSAKSLTALQMVLPGEKQSDITVHMSVGKLKDNKKITDAQGLPSVESFSVAERASLVSTFPDRKWWNPQCFVQEKCRLPGQSAHPQSLLRNQVNIPIADYITEPLNSQIWLVGMCWISFTRN